MLYVQLIYVDSSNKKNQSIQTQRYVIVLGIDESKNIFFYLLPINFVTKQYVRQKQLSILATCVSASGLVIKRLIF